MPPTRILHISDTHLGYRQYGSDTRRDDFADALERAVAVAVDREVDAVIHTGDLFDDPVPALSTVMRCADALKPLESAEIPLYGVVGNHERKNDEQWLDLLKRTNAVTRLGREPTVVGEVALYGIDAVRKTAWDSTEFELSAPPEETSYTMLCMHELLEPPVNGRIADHSLSDVLKGVNLDLGGLALGDLHQPASTHVDGTDVWYASATEQSAKGQDDTGVVQLLEIENGSLTRRQIELDTRPFRTLTINFGEDDGPDHARDVLGRHDLTDAVAKIELVGEQGAVTTNEVANAARDDGAVVVSVDDSRGRADLDVASIEAMSLQGLDDAIENRLSEKELSDVARSVDEQIRLGGGLGNTPATAADEIEPMLEEAQSAVFEDESDLSDETTEMMKVAADGDNE